MKLFFDTNILIDLLTERSPFYDDAKTIVGMCDRGEAHGVFASFSVCNIIYILRKGFNPKELRECISELSNILEMLDTRAAEVKAALEGDDSDFEDAVQRICAEENGADVIITRDKDGFANATIPVMTPTEFLDKIERE